MFFLVLAAVCLACIAGWWWLGVTATPGQRAIEERVRARRKAWRSSVASIPSIFGGRGQSRGLRDAEFWTRSAPAEAVPEPDEHKQAWRS